jgi:FecR protein
VPDLKTARSDRVNAWRSVFHWTVSLSAVALVAATVAWWVQRAGRPDSSAASHSARPEIRDEAAGRQRLVAEVTYVSSVSIWRNPNNSYALASGVRSGQSLTLERGQIELTYSSGAKLLLTGPFEFVVRATGGSLRRGELVARVPEAGHGFTIETPHGKVIDLGTEFRVVVDDFGVSQVSVFEGKVETLPTGSAGTSGDKIELTSGRAIQWTDKSIVPIDLQGRRYQHPRDDLSSSQLPRSEKTSIVEDFRGKPLSKERWRTLGDVAPTSGGLRLGADTKDGQRPYLLTARELDPSQGLITIACDLRFENMHDAENASFAILTRSSDQQSRHDTPWRDMLAQSVRCRFKVELLSGEGMLEAGTKYEADREHTNISWGGFSRPQPDTLYHLEMRDDGLNVNFTVSLAERPSVRKTITCRSLFRGNQNFIALEGSSTATTVVEQLMISQDRAPDSDSDLIASSAADNSRDHDRRTSGAVQRLEDLVPASAELLVKDDFDDGQLNNKIWSTLGDVVVKDGQVQLGLPNEEQHIDTWRDRPYLLTKEQFDPTNGALIIIGQATFAANFLHGYGGSFAVVTRGDNARGGGPGWESSILRRGVRSNFWPAAYGFDHSLEIHEKPEPNTTVLLTAEGFQISPNSRSYLFRVVDDGRSATLTFIDTANPSIRKTISHAITSPALKAGYLGFESCWGSPVLLDRVRIFRSDEDRPQQDE